MKNKYTYIRLCAVMLFVFLINSTVIAVGVNMDGSVNEKVLHDVAQYKIFFGHQSVGFNIMNGVESIYRNSNIPINIAEDSVDGLQESFFLHAPVGKNKDPKSKIDDFARKIIDLDGNIDIAFLKFCYVDFRDGVDVKDVYTYYDKKINMLSDKYPHIKFVHLTSPLTIKKETWKTKLKLLFGVGGLWEYRDNVVRNQYNSILLSDESKTTSIFDIARYEATSADGSVEKFSYEGNDYLYLDPRYSSDGGHLNEQGSQWVAGKLLDFIQKIGASK